MYLLFWMFHAWFYPLSCVLSTLWGTFHMTLVDPCVVHEKNTHPITLVDPYVVHEKNRHEVTLVDPYVVCLEEHTCNDTGCGS